MANEEETLTDIATWLFVDYHEICPWLVDGGSCAKCPLGGNGKNCIFDKIANKISGAAERERGNLDALERACEEVLDADKLKAVIAAKRRIQGEPGGGYVNPTLFSERPKKA